MYEWFIGQKIVCINTSSIDGSLPYHVLDHLKVGNIYTIRDIVLYPYTNIGSQIGFFLQGIVSPLYVNLHDTKGFREYAFYYRRFKPLEEDKTDISIFTSLLNDVKDGKVKFNDEDEIEERQFKKRKKKVKEVEKID